jgi:hypothetical protein
LGAHLLRETLGFLLGLFRPGPQVIEDGPQLPNLRLDRPVEPFDEGSRGGFGTLRFRLRGLQGLAPHLELRLDLLAKLLDVFAMALLASRGGISR